MSRVISSEILEKYGIQGPRYNTCTPAMELSDYFSASDFVRHIASSNTALLPRPLALYIHTPISQEKAQAYLNYLYREIDLLTPHLAKDRLVKRIHFSSAASNCLSAAQFREFFDVIARQFHLSYPEDLAISLHVDPRFTNLEQLAQLANIGINRICIGENEKNLESQAAVNSIPNLQQFETTIQAARESDIQSICVELNVGLSNQTREAFSEILKMITESGVDRITLFNSAEHPERILSLRPLDSEPLSDWLTRIAIITDALDFLSQQNYVHLGMFQFVLPEDSLAQAFNTNQLRLSFQGYQTHAEYDEFGLGVGATTQVGDAYSQNTKALLTYYAILDSGQLPVQKGVSMNQDGLVRACIIQLILCQRCVSFRAINSRFDIDFESYFEFELMQLSFFEDDGLLCIDDSKLVVSTHGRFFLRNISMVFERS